MKMVQKNLQKILKTKRLVFVIPVVVKQNQLRPLCSAQSTRREILVLNKKGTLLNLQLKRLCNLHLAKGMKRNRISYTVSCCSILPCFLCSPS